MLLIKRMIFLTSTTPAAATASALPSSALEELKIGLNGFNELVLPIFGRHSSPLGGEWRSSSPETGRPAATPLRRGSDPQIRSKPLLRPQRTLLQRQSPPQSYRSLNSAGRASACRPRPRPEWRTAGMVRG